MLTMYTLPYNSFFFFFNDTATTEIYTLSLHDALPILVLTRQAVKRQRLVDVLFDPAGELRILRRPLGEPSGQIAARDRKSTRLNSSHSQISYAVFCLKKKKT